jgi:prephenate dehydratase
MAVVGNASIRKDIYRDLSLLAGLNFHSPECLSENLNVFIEVGLNMTKNDKVQESHFFSRKVGSEGAFFVKW